MAVTTCFTCAHLPSWLPLLNKLQPSCSAFPRHAACPWIYWQIKACSTITSYFLDRAIRQRSLKIVGIQELLQLLFFPIFRGTVNQKLNTFMKSLTLEHSPSLALSLSLSLSLSLDRTVRQHSLEIVGIQELIQLFFPFLEGPLTKCSTF